MRSAELEGVRVLDITRLLPGAIATQMLACAGAEVIKIEQPGAGDYARTLTPEVFEKTNRGKKSIALDLKTSTGKQALMELAAKADVLVEGFRPGVMERLGLDYARLEEACPRLIYASLSGYGQAGPEAGLAGHDINYLAMSGILHLSLPVIPGVQLADIVGGSMQAVLRILLALHARQRTGRGAFLDISMTDGLRPLLTIPLATTNGGAMLRGQYACYNVYRTRDRRWLAVGALEDKFWAELCRKLGCEELITAQYDNAKQTEVKERLAAIFALRDAEEWFADLRASDCCVTPVRTPEEAAGRYTGDDSERAPLLGEHTREFLG